MCEMTIASFFSLSCMHLSQIIQYASQGSWGCERLEMSNTIRSPHSKQGYNCMLHFLLYVSIVAVGTRGNDPGKWWPLLLHTSLGNTWKAPQWWISSSGGTLIVNCCVDVHCNRCSKATISWIELAPQTTFCEQRSCTDPATMMISIYAIHLVQSNSAQDM